MEASSGKVRQAQDGRVTQVGEGEVFLICLPRDGGNLGRLSWPLSGRILLSLWSLRSVAFAEDFSLS